MSGDVTTVSGAPASGARRPSVALLGFLTAIDAISIDSYVPALPALARELSTSATAVQSTLAVFLVGIALGQALWGPISDCIGRRRPLLLGLACYLAGSLLGAAAPNLLTLIVARLLQATGASAGLVIARAVVADAWPGEQTARLYSLMMQVLGVTALFSPLLGGILLTAGSWRYIFLMMTATAALATLWTVAGLPETHPAGTRAARPAGSWLAAFAALLKEHSFLWATATSALALATMFVLLAGSPFIFVREYRWSNLAFSALYSATSIAFIAVCELNKWLLRRTSAARLLSAGLWIQLALTIAFLVLALTRRGGAWAFAALMVALVGLLGVILGNAVAEAMRRAPALLLGSSSAVIGVAQFLASALATPLSTTAPSNVGASVALTAAAGTAAALGCAWCARVPRLSR